MKGAGGLSRVVRFAVGCGAMVALVAGCGPRGDASRGPASERSGTRGRVRYSLRSQVEPARVTVGDRAIWRLTAELSGDAAPETLLRASTDSTLEIRPLGPPRAVRNGNRTAWSASFEARGFDIGRLPLPALLLPIVHSKSARDTLEFPPDTLFVDSLTPAMTGSVEPDRKTVPTELRAIDWVVAIVGGALVLGLIVALVRAIMEARRRSRHVEQLEAAPEPPEAVYLRAIDVLRGEMALLPRDQFYDRLSLAVRSYVAAVTGVPALDRTTWELSRELAERSELDGDSIAAVERMLSRSDLAKFARQEDPLVEAASALDQAVALSGRLRREPVGALAGVGPGNTAAPPSKPGGEA